MNKEAIFKHILESCKEKSSIEKFISLKMQRLQEMGVSSITTFIDNIVNDIRNKIFTQENIEYWKAYSNNTYKTKEFQNRLTDQLKDIIIKFINKNDRPHGEKPFVIINNNGELLIYEDRNEQRIQSYEQVLKNAYVNNHIKVRNGSNTFMVRSIKRIKETSNDEIEQWVQNGINIIVQDLSGTLSSRNKGHLMLAKDYASVIKDTFISKYKQLQGLE